MKQQYLKTIIIIGIFSILLNFNLFGINAMAKTEINLNEIITEMSVDIKYIKDNISEIKEDNQKLQSEIIRLGNKVAIVEERQTNIKANLCEITERNNWFIGLVGSLLIITLGMQIKRSSSYRKNNGKENH